MKFNIDSDDGHVIRFWLTLDHPSDIPAVEIKSAGHKIATLTANVNRSDLRDHDLHTTGQAGFLIDESIINDLAQLSDLLITEQVSGVPIYARFQPKLHVDKKLLIWARSSEMLLRDSVEFIDKFCLKYIDLETQNSETVSSVFGNTQGQSIIAIGRPNLLRLSELIHRQNFNTIFVISDPYYDLAERLIALRSSDEVDNQNFSINDMIIRLKETEFSNNRSLTRFFRTLEGNDRLSLRSPVVRALTRAPEDDVRRQDVSVALKVLSKYDFVSTDQTFNLFSSQIEGLSTLDGSPKLPPDMVSLADSLRNIGPVSDILNEDVALYHYIGRAAATAKSKLFEARGDAR